MTETIAIWGCAIHPATRLHATVTLFPDNTYRATVRRGGTERDGARLVDEKDTVSDFLRRQYDDRQGLVNDLALTALCVAAQEPLTDKRIWARDHYERAD